MATELTEQHATVESQPKSMRMLIGSDGSDGSRDAMMTDLAEEEKIDLIVVGSPHRGAIGRTLIGSVAENLLHGAPCPVAVAPRGYAAELHKPFRQIAVAYDGTPESKAALHRAEALAAQASAPLEIFTVVAPPVTRSTCWSPARAATGR